MSHDQRSGRGHDSIASHGLLACQNCTEYTRNGCTITAGFVTLFRSREKRKGDDYGKVFDFCSADDLRPHDDEPPQSPLRQCIRFGPVAGRMRRGSAEQAGRPRDRAAIKAARFGLYRVARLPGQVRGLSWARCDRHGGRSRSVAQSPRNGLAPIREPRAQALRLESSDGASQQRGRRAGNLDRRYLAAQGGLHAHDARVGRRTPRECPYCGSLCLSLGARRRDTGPGPPDTVAPRRVASAILKSLLVSSAKRDRPFWWPKPTCYVVCLLKI